MTALGPHVAEVIRSCLDEFLDEYAKLTPRTTPPPADMTACCAPRPWGSRPELPGVWHQHRLQLLRQPPLSDLPGHRRAAVADAGARGRFGSRTVLPHRLHALILDPIALANPRVVYDLLLPTRRSRPAPGGSQSDRLGARTGVLAVFHTCALTKPNLLSTVSPGGGLSLR